MIYYSTNKQFTQQMICFEAGQHAIMIQEKLGRNMNNNKHFLTLQWAGIDDTINTSFFTLI